MMANHGRATRDKDNKNEEAGKKNRVRQKESRPLFEQSNAHNESIRSLTETPFDPRMEEHAEILSRIPFSVQRHEFIMQLHQTYGNKYVQRLIESMKVQAKMTVNAPNDIYEQEADRVAETVTEAIQIPVSRQEEEEEPVMPVLQRQEEEEEPVMLALQRQEEKMQMHPAERNSKYIAQRINGPNRNGNSVKSIGSDIVQRRVAYAPTRQGGVLDWIVLKSIHFVKRIVGGPVAEWDQTNFGQMNEGDTLGLTGHGSVGGSVGYKSKDDVKNDLFYTEGKKLKAEPKEILITSCHAGEGVPSDTLVGMIKDELDKKGWKKTKVSGAKGPAISWEGTRTAKYTGGVKSTHATTIKDMLLAKHKPEKKVREALAEAEASGEDLTIEQKAELAYNLASPFYEEYVKTLKTPNTDSDLYKENLNTPGWRFRLTQQQKSLKTYMENDGSSLLQESPLLVLGGELEASAKAPVELGEKPPGTAEEADRYIKNYGEVNGMIMEACKQVGKLTHSLIEEQMTKMKVVEPITDVNGLIENYGECEADMTRRLLVFYDLVKKHLSGEVKSDKVKQARDSAIDILESLNSLIALSIKIGLNKKAVWILLWGIVYKLKLGMPS